MFGIFADEDESYRWARIALCVLAAAVTVAILTACGDSEFERQQRIAESNAKIARAAIPQGDERRIFSWAVNPQTGKRVLYYSIQKPIGQRGNVAQFVLVDEGELE